MDFWSRLVAGTALSPSSNKASANNPEKRLARFKREYNQLLSIWRSATNFARDQDAADNVRGSIQEITSILNDESRRPSPHPCIAFASTKQIYIPISKIATTSYNEPIIREAVQCFSTLIDSEEEDFLESDEFSKSLMNLLVRITGQNSIRLGLDTEVEVVELTFGIAAKIRLQPEILSAWFFARADRSVEEYKDAHEKFAGKTHKEDFPLFYLLIDYIHHEGRIGDFARTGLLYIIESASTSLALEQWIVESDLATLMATGLGALYSQLSRKLVIDYPRNELPSILAFSDYEHPVTSLEIVSSASEDFQGHMETFLSHLLFWQDVLEHCKSVEVKQTLLEHFQVIFLQQLLYPSLLESSDIDGGSSVAVLTYLRRILETLDHPDMIHLILHYLLALPDTTPVRPSGSRTVSEARRRKSMDLATMMASQTEAQSTPDLFNLVDLILGSLRSRNYQTVAATLQLLSVILRRHHRYAVPTLLRTSRVPHDKARRTIGAHNKETEFLFSLAGDIGGEENFDEIYDNHIRDTQSILESHPCSQTLIGPKTAKGNMKLPGAQASIPGAPRDVTAHTMRLDDPILKSLLNILETFFLNPVDINLCLTETFIDLAACGFMHIEGWFVPDPYDYTYDDDDDAEQSTLRPENSTLTLMELSFELQTPEAEELERQHAIRRAQRIPIWPKTAIPPFLKHLQTLVSQLKAYRSEIPRFEDLLRQRKDTFQTAAAAAALPMRQPQPQRSSFDAATDRSGSPPLPPGKPSAFDSLAQRIFPDLGTPSRSSSPRGRRSQEQQRSTNTPPLIPNRQGVYPPPQFPMPGSLPVSLDTPSRGSSRAFSPSPLRDSETPSRPPMSRGVASQVAAFAAVDRTILARKYGVPQLNGEGEVQPIPFPKLRPDVVDAGSSTQASSVAGDTATSTVSTSTTEERSSSSEADSERTDDDEDAEDNDDQADDEKEEEKTVTVSHILTNVIILQEFLLELAALVQVRAGLFGEVSFV